MKKAGILLTLILSASMLQAQSEKEKGFVLEANVGVVNYINYPAVSLFLDETEYYRASTEIIVFGYRFSDFMIGAQWQFSNMYTSKIDLNEAMIQNGFSILTRGYKSLNDVFEIYGGFKFSYSLMNNCFKYNDEVYNFSRSGIGCEFELGANFNISAMSYLGFRIGVNPFSSNFEKKIELPLVESANSKTIVNNYNISITYGMKF